MTDLGAALAAGIPPIGEVVPGLVYERGAHLWHGPPKAGKTFLALWVAEQTWRRTGRPTVWIDHEMGLHQLGRAIGPGGLDWAPADATAILRYVPFPSGLHDLGVTGVVTTLEATVREHNAAAFTIDSLGKQLSQLNLNEYDNPDVTTWTSRVLLPAVEALGVPGHVIDHVTKTGGDGWARGAGEKMAAVALAWNVTSTEPFSKYERGRINVANHGFDRFGSMRATEQFRAGGQGDGGTMRLTRVEPDDQVHVTRAPGSREAEQRRAAVKAELEAGPASTAHLVEVAGVAERTVRRYLSELGATNSRGTWALPARPDIG